MSFSPDPANVQVGQEIRWHNGDIFAHTATSTGRVDFDTGIIAVNATSVPIIVRSPGAVGYRCSIHPTMVGTLNVTP